jgi:MFS transporter, DHA1 family, multidrug resistance protein
VTATFRGSRRRPPLAVLIAISMLQPFALNVLAPATPALARSLATDYATVQLTLTVYLVTVALSQLVVGPISDKIGRRPCILAGIALFALGSLLGALAQDIAVLLLARAVQAAGGGTCFTLSRAVVRDTASKDESASIIGYLATVMVLAPMVAPLIGGFLDAEFGWRSIFWACAVFSLLVIAGSMAFLSETAPGTQSSGLYAFVRGYPDLLRDRAFLGHALALAFTSASFFAFIAGAPYVVVEYMGREPDVYGFFFMLNAVGYMIGNFVSGRFGQRLGSERLARIGIVISVVSVLLETACLLTLPWTPATLFVPLALNAVGNGMTIPGGTASALSVRPNFAGAAAGLVGATQLGFGALASILVGYLVPIWPASLVTVMLVLVLSGWAALLLHPRVQT